MGTHAFFITVSAIRVDFYDAKMSTFSFSFDVTKLWEPWELFVDVLQGIFHILPVFKKAGSIYCICQKYEFFTFSKLDKIIYLFNCRNKQIFANPLKCAGGIKKLAHFLHWIIADMGLAAISVMKIFRLGLNVIRNNVNWAKYFTLTLLTKKETSVVS